MPATAATRATSTSTLARGVEYVALDFALAVASASSKLMALARLPGASGALSWPSAVAVAVAVVFVVVLEDSVPTTVSSALSSMVVLDEPWIIKKIYFEE